MMGKMVVLKPVVWNGQGYLGPTGEHTSTGYAGDHGYGHEEWNGRADWVWENWRVFHTQGKGRMFDYAASGGLGIVMTTMLNGKFYAVGAAAAVYDNDEATRAAIANELDLRSNAKQVWSLPAVKALKNDRAKFLQHWDAAYSWVQWRCPQSHYIWFDRPVRFNPDDVIPSGDPKRPRAATVKMHSGYQQVRPDQALAVMGKRLPPSHPIRGWLMAGDFDEVRNKAVRLAPVPRVTTSKRSAATASDAHTRYLQEHELQVTPKHHILQSAFEAFLRTGGEKEVTANLARVDVRYEDQRLGPVLAEIKPCDQQTVRYAIRAGMGQLLDYRQRNGGNPNLLLVVDCEPADQADKLLAMDNGFGLAWRSKKGFSIEWPDQRTGATPVWRSDAKTVAR